MSEQLDTIFSFVPSLCRTPNSHKYCLMSKDVLGRIILLLSFSCVPLLSLIGGIVVVVVVIAPETNSLCFYHAWPIN